MTSHTTLATKTKYRDTLRKSGIFVLAVEIDLKVGKEDEKILDDFRAMCACSNWTCPAIDPAR